MSTTTETTETTELDEIENLEELNEAIRNNNVFEASRLLTAGVGLEMEPKVFPQAKSTEMLQCLLDHGIDIDTIQGDIIAMKVSTEALINAVEDNRHDLAEFLLQLKLDKAEIQKVLTETDFVENISTGMATLLRENGIEN